MLVSSDYNMEDGPGRDKRDERWARLDCTRPGYLVSAQRRPTATMTTDDSSGDDGESGDDDVSVSYDGDDSEGGEDERGGRAGHSR